MSKRQLTHLFSEEERRKMTIQLTGKGKILFNHLVDLAKASQITHYGDVADFMGFKRISGHYNSDYHEFGKLMGEVNEECHRNGKPLITSIIVLKALKYVSSRECGEGFYQLAKKLGKFTGKLSSKKDKQDFWLKEMSLTMAEKWRKLK